MSMTIDIEKRQIIKIQIKKIGIVLISMLVTFMIAMGPIAKVDGFNVLPWLDIPFHIWGGFLLGMLGVRIITLLESNKKYSEEILNIDRLEYAYRYLLLIVIFVMFWGFIWEAWEYWMYITHRSVSWGGVLDTCKDLFDDMVGAVLSYIFTLKKVNKNK